jgi:hypothetical protein
LRCDAHQGGCVRLIWINAQFLSALIDFCRESTSPIVCGSITPAELGAQASTTAHGSATDAGGPEKRVTFNVDDLADSTDLARWAHGRQAVEPGTGKLHAATIYYETVAEAQELYAYLVRNAPCDHKIAW